MTWDHKMLQYYKYIRIWRKHGEAEAASLPIWTVCHTWAKGEAVPSTLDHYFCPTSQIGKILN